jgi:hypothetical protein
MSDVANRLQVGGAAGSWQRREQTVFHNFLVMSPITAKYLSGLLLSRFLGQWLPQVNMS